MGGGEADDERVLLEACLLGRSGVGPERDPRGRGQVLGASPDAAVDTQSRISRLVGGDERGVGGEKGGQTPRAMSHAWAYWANSSPPASQLQSIGDPGAAW